MSRTAVGERPEDLMRVIDALSGRWSVLVLDGIAGGHCRFNQLQRHLAGINHKVLIETLFRLQRDGFVRGPLTAPGDAAAYALTPLGRELRELFGQIRGWSERNRPYLASARERFADRHG